MERNKLNTCDVQGYSGLAVAAGPISEQLC